ncbi:hypothetical protein ACLVWQ_03625 [Streptomyces sp. CWNU-52B]|uniref:hypothetical protein n=1 Tax=unclassified Streptomyces TaxID=2593676 RepID=UPI0039BF8612
MARRTTTLALGVLVAAGVLVGSPTAAFADGVDGERPDVAAPKKPPAAEAAPQAAHNQYFGPFVTVQPGQNGLATVSCPSGLVPTGGGGASSAYRIFFTDSFVSNGNTWVVRGTNTGTTAESIQAFVICTKP